MENTSTNIIKKKVGRPLKYEPQYDNNGKRITASFLNYHKRGYIICKIKGLKQKYGFTYPNVEDYANKPETELLQILKKMNTDIFSIMETRTTQVKMAGMVIQAN